MDLTFVLTLPVQFFQDFKNKFCYSPAVYLKTSQKIILHIQTFQH